jgi:hypothetical protein
VVVVVVVVVENVHYESEFGHTWSLFLKLINDCMERRLVGFDVTESGL